MAKVIMVQGTMSGVGKSILVAGLCRMFSNAGYSVAPFKAQNMALNSFVTKEGGEIGRAQALQAFAARKEPSVAMNPILLKPTSHVGSQVILHGKVLGNKKAKDYFAMKKDLMPEILSAFYQLEQEADIIVIEGAGSPAEINLKENDIVNMGLAKALHANVLLVGDIEPGGVFAQLVGTLALLEAEEVRLVKGLIINKFRGDKSILDPGIDMLEEKTNKKVIGTLPFLEMDLEEEDSFTKRWDNKKKGLITVGCIRYPRVSNLTDLQALERYKEISVIYATKPQELEGVDVIVLPGSKNTIEDLRWLKEQGFAALIQQFQGMVFGICGGYQMLGTKIVDEFGVEIEGGGEEAGLGCLEAKTYLGSEKTKTLVEGELLSVEGEYSFLSKGAVKGYEIHMGTTISQLPAFAKITSEQFSGEKEDGSKNHHVFGTYIHGIFDQKDMVEGILKYFAKKKGVSLGEQEQLSYEQYQDRQLDRLAEEIEKYFDITQLYDLLQEADYDRKKASRN